MLATQSGDGEGASDADPERWMTEVQGDLKRVVTGLASQAAKPDARRRESYVILGQMVMRKRKEK